MMGFVIYLGIIVAVLGFISLGFSIWALVTHREKRYKALLEEHIAQRNRVQARLGEEDGDYQ